MAVTKNAAQASSETAAADVASAGKRALKPGEKVMSVQTALEEAMKLYSAGTLEQAFKLVSQLVAARPRVAVVRSDQP